VQTGSEKGLVRVHHQPVIAVNAQDWSGQMVGMAWPMKECIYWHETLV
jgi:hypothetical protein